MQPYGKFRIRVRELDCLRSSRLINHEARAGQNAVAMRANYSCIGLFVRSKVVRVDNEISHPGAVMAAVTNILPAYISRGPVRSAGTLAGAE